jgi:hypothetical protein
VTVGDETRTRDIELGRKGILRGIGEGVERTMIPLLAVMAAASKLVRGCCVVVASTPTGFFEE